jgi:hypothetical protein
MVLMIVGSGESHRSLVHHGIMGVSVPAWPLARSGFGTNDSPWLPGGGVISQRAPPPRDLRSDSGCGRAEPHFKRAGSPRHPGRDDALQ